MNVLFRVFYMHLNTESPRICLYTACYNTSFTNTTYSLFTSPLLQGAAPTDAASPPTPRPPTSEGLLSIVEILTLQNRFDLLVGLVVDAGLVPPLEAEGPITVFAPVNSAFTALNLPADTAPEVIEAVLLYHVASGAVALQDGMSVTTLNGADVVLTVAGGEVKVNESNIVETIAASNGIIYVIDEVLIPPMDPAPAPTPRGGGRSLRAF